MSSVRAFLTNYVKRGENKGRKYIHDIPKQTVTDKERIVYRGQTGDTITIPARNGFFSTSKDADVASGYGDRLFKLHLMPGTRYLDIHQLFENESMDNPYEKEEEILVFGGGEFCKQDVKPEYIELWYAPSCLNTTRRNANRNVSAAPNNKIQWESILQQAKNEGYADILDDLPDTASELTNVHKQELATLFGLTMRGGSRKRHATRRRRTHRRRL